MERNGRAKLGKQARQQQQQQVEERIICIAKLSPMLINWMRIKCEISNGARQRDAMRAAWKCEAPHWPRRPLFMCTHFNKSSIGNRHGLAVVTNIYVYGYQRNWNGSVCMDTCSIPNRVRLHVQFAHARLDGGALVNILQSISGSLSEYGRRACVIDVRPSITFETET